MEQDSFIGSKFKDLEVVAWDGARDRGAKAYTVVCRRCELDPELHGSATYKVTKHYLNQGKTPCGCGKGVNWTDEQHDIRLKRTVDASIKYTRLEPKGVLAKHSCECKICGSKWISNVKSLLDGMGCRKCANNKKVLPDSNRVEQFMSTGTFLEGTKFWTERKKNNQDRYIWYYTCPECSNDSYVKAGVCSGIFETNSNALIKGGVACRCSRSYRKTKEQQIYAIKIKCKENNHNFICLRDGKFGYHDRVLLECLEHGVIDVDIGGYLTQDRECPHCRTYGFKKHLPATFYVLEITKGDLTFTGFGITNEPEVRFAAHKRELLKQDYSLIKTQMFDVKGEDARHIEDHVKKFVSIVNLDVDGFKRECCINDFDYVVSIVSEKIQ